MKYEVHKLTQTNYKLLAYCPHTKQKKEVVINNNSNYKYRCVCGHGFT